MSSNDKAKFELVRPGREHLASYRQAMDRGWSPEHLRGAEAIEDHLTALDQDSEGYLATLDDPDGLGPPIKLPDGSEINRLPSITRWIWDGNFAGLFSLRWPRQGEQLPAHVLGNIGFSVVPWRQNRGYATRGLAMILDEAWGRGLDRVTLTTNPDNLASQSVILKNGGNFRKSFEKDSRYGGGEGLLYEIVSHRAF